MTRRRTISGGLAVFITGLVGVLSIAPASGKERSRSDPVKIGLVGSLFRDTPLSLVKAMSGPFAAMMEAHTGLKGQLVPAGPPDQLAKLLVEDELQLGIFHGVEFSWVRQQYPKLRPLMIAVNQHHHLRALLVTRKETEATGFADLQGKKLAVPRHSREHCHLFLSSRCQACGSDPNTFFAQLTKPSNVEDALDDVVDDKVQVAVVDGLAIESFKRRKPSRFAQLKTVQRSEIFPAAIVVYHEGALDEETLESFREGMINVKKSALGRQLMGLWRLTGFEQIPADYEQTLADIVKAYPPPTPAEPK